MFKTVQTEELVTATGGIGNINLSQITAPKYNVKPPVWPRRVDGHRVDSHPGNPNPPHVGF